MELTTVCLEPSARAAKEPVFPKVNHKSSKDYLPLTLLCAGRLSFCDRWSRLSVEGQDELQRR